MVRPDGRQVMLLVCLTGFIGVLVPVSDDTDTIGLFFVPDLVPGTKHQLGEQFDHFRRKAFQQQISSSCSFVAKSRVEFIIVVFVIGSSSADSV